MPYNKKGQLCGTGRHPTVFKYGYKEIAELMEMSVEAVRELKFRAETDLGNLKNLIELYNAKMSLKRLREELRGKVAEESKN